MDKKTHLFLRIILIFKKNINFSLAMPVTLHVVHQLWRLIRSSIFIQCCFYWMIIRGLVFLFRLHLLRCIHRENSQNTSLPTFGHFYAGVQAGMRVPSIFQYYFAESKFFFYKKILRNYFKSHHSKSSSVTPTFLFFHMYS
jgi:hypothetical protein